jgi:hypothetical protein
MPNLRLAAPLAVSFALLSATVTAQPKVPPAAPKGAQADAKTFSTTSPKLTRRKKVKAEVSAQSAGTMDTYLVELANMSTYQVFAVSTDNGGHWANVSPPIGKNCTFSTVDQCTANGQYTPLFTTNCPTNLTVGLRYRDTQGQGWEGYYPTFPADCKYRGMVLGLTQ